MSAKNFFCSAVAITLVTANAFSAKANDSIVVSKDSTSGELPPTLEKRLAPGFSKGDFDALIAGQPELIIDGAQLSISAPAVGSTVSFAVNKLVLKNNAKIVTNGVNVEFAVGKISSAGGEIIAFTNTQMGEAPQGENGAAGLQAGSVTVDGEIDGNDVLRVALIGQPGQKGGKGIGGPIGAAGTRGGNSADHLFDCAHGAGNGGNGAPGGPGGNGGNGGAGGDGGILVLKGALAEQRAQIDFIFSGGPGGLGGDPGDGGKGGPGGPGGRGSTYCHGGAQGQDGPSGQLGARGTVGPKGKDGAIFSD